MMLKERNVNKLLESDSGAVANLKVDLICLGLLNQYALYENESKC